VKKGIILGINFESHCYMIMNYCDHSIHSVREAVFFLTEHQPANITIKDNNINIDIGTLQPTNFPK